MDLGIMVTIVSGFGKKGFYHSQELGLAKKLSEMGHSVCVYKCVSQDAQYAEETADGNITVKYIPVKKLGVHGFLPASRLDTAMDGLLIFADTQLFLPHIFRFCSKHGIKAVPYIGIAHSFQETLKSKVMDVLFSAGSLRYYRKLPVLAKTNAARDELLNLGVRDCTVAPVGLDESELKTDFKDTDREELRKEFGYSASDVVILFVARLKPEKRPLDMIDIFAHVRKKKACRLLIVGEGPLRDEIDRKAQSLGLTEDLRIIDRIPYEKMWQVYRIADYFVNLRAEEIFGMAVMEAVFYETSVAAIKAPGPSTILEGMKGHRICESDAGVEEWLGSEYPAAEDLRESSAKILDGFTWESYASRFIERVQK